jgi:cyanophycin synthetase
MVMRDPMVDVAVLETARGGLLRRGMGYRRCNVGAVLNVQADHLGLKGIDTLEQLAEVKRIVIEVATDCAVLNADDEHCLRMADHTDAKKVCYVTMNPRHPLVAEHIRSGGPAAVLEESIAGHMITLYDEGRHVPLLWTHRIPATLDGRALHNVQNAMFAAAITHSMGVTLDEIRHGLMTFDTTYFQAPGRMNVYHDHPFKVILDYGHNPHAVQAMAQLVERLAPKGRRIVVLAAPGDRRDEDVREIARHCAGRFDRYICRRDDALRGRGADEIPQKLREALLDADVDDAAIELVPDEQDAVERALRLGRREDLVLIFADKVQRAWQQIQEFQPDEDQLPEHELAPRPPQLEAIEVPAVAYGAAEQLIRDERGVRLAREPLEDD